MDTQRLKAVVASRSTAARWLMLLLLMMPALSGRAAPAVPISAIAVNTTADELDGFPGNGHCSLREAIINANNDDGGQADCPAGSGADSITLPDGTYTLTGAAGEDFNASGDLDIRDDLTINGASAQSTIIQAGTDTTNGVDRVLHIADPHKTVEINDVTIRYGKTPDGASGASASDGERGGGIFNYFSTLTLNDCSVIYNRTGDGGDGTAGPRGEGGWGGGIQVQWGTLILNDTVVAYNETGAGGNAAAGSRGGWGGRGGGIYVFGSAVALTNSTVRNNDTGDGGNGGEGGGNGGFGGHSAGIYADEGTPVAVIGGTISGNATCLGTRGGAGSETGSDGADGGRGNGGGLYVIDGSHLSLSDSTLSGNAAFHGGGIGSEAGEIVTMANCTLSDNYVLDSGGGIYNGSLTTLEMTNCTLSGNRSEEDGGGIYGGSTADATLTYVTVTDNTADVDNNGFGNGGGFKSLGIITMTNTIVAENIDKGGENPDCRGTVTSGDYNLLGISDSAHCSFTSQAHDQEGTTALPLDPMLANLTDNGGPTETHRLGASSPAVDEIPNGVNGCVVGIRDQRGVPRFPPCDIGSYEIDRAAHIYLPLTLG